jgi:Protein of unknown function with HXXEE motif
MSAVHTTRRRRTIAFRALRFRQAVWLVPAVFAVHVLEEAPGFTDWVNRYASEQYSSDDFVRINALGLLLTAGATLVVARTSNRTVFFVFYSTILTQQALWNTAFHVGSSAGFAAYSPGVVTSVLLLLPLWWHLTRLALSERLISRRGVAAAALIGGLIHAAAVAQQVFFVEFT